MVLWLLPVHHQDGMRLTQRIQLAPPCIQTRVKRRQVMRNITQTEAALLFPPPVSSSGQGQLSSAHPRAQLLTCQQHQKRRSRHRRLGTGPLPWRTSPPLGLRMPLLCLQMGATQPAMGAARSL